ASAASEVPPGVRPAFWTSLARLFLERRLFPDADRIVRQAEQEGLLDERLARIGAEASLGMGDKQRMVRLARRAVPETARDYRDLLWLARLLEIGGDPEEAADLFRRAAEQNPTVLEFWPALT